MAFGFENTSSICKEKIGPCPHALLTSLVRVLNYLTNTHWTTNDCEKRYLRKCLPDIESYPSDTCVAAIDSKQRITEVNFNTRVYDEDDSRESMKLQFPER